MVLLPLVEAVGRKLFGVGVPGSSVFVQHLTLWVAFLGAALAAREGKLLALATGELFKKMRIGGALKSLGNAVAAAATVLLARASLDLVILEREAATELPLSVPIWVALSVLPISFTLIAARLVGSSAASWRGRIPALVGLTAGLVIGHYPQLLEGHTAWPGLILILIGTLAGGPIFAALGGAAILLFLAEGVPAAAVPAETYRLAVSPTLPAIPLFTLAGFLVAQGDASKRLLRVFRAFLGWLPGGTAIVVAVLCAFFTVFTGGSGVTILALGGLLFKAMQSDGYRENFSLGLLTGSGSLGLLFAPALPLILYGIVAEIPIRDLFLGGLVPGVLMLSLVAGWGLWEGLRRGGGKRQAFAWRETGAALWIAKWEIALPFLVLGAIFSGLATLVEVAAMTAFYAFVVQSFVHRDLGLRKDLFRVMGECVVLLGGILIILGVAMGLTNYFVDAQIPDRVLAWGKESIASPLLFLLALNIFLLIVGCLMDIFSAIIVVVPLIVPMGLAFGIDPIHLGIIFVANLELGYLTPPVGLNLFLASYRFERPILQIWRAAIPMLVILGIGVLLITYVPWLTLGLLEWVGRE
ncbi:MAG: TRAP transporter large permease subunit [Acidobacteria bacterium]|nr:TRAP transporter large permease subunit [Acidobacteriota bacterium]